MQFETESLAVAAWWLDDESESITEWCDSHTFCAVSCHLLSLVKTWGICLTAFSSFLYLTDSNPCHYGGRNTRSDCLLLGSLQLLTYESNYAISRKYIGWELLEFFYKLGVFCHWTRNGADLQYWKFPRIKAKRKSVWPFIFKKHKTDWCICLCLQKYVIQI